jgi:hypothetical protein
VLERLREGNRRFVSNVRSLDALLSHARRAELAAGQRPFAIVLGCSDSRVPAEVVFVHRTRAPERTVVLMVEGAGIVPTGDCGASCS